MVLFSSSLKLAMLWRAASSPPSPTFRLPVYAEAEAHAQAELSTSSSNSSSSPRIDYDPRVLYLIDHSASESDNAFSP